MIIKKNASAHQIINLIRLFKIDAGGDGKQLANDGLTLALAS